ncbi:WD40 repeat-like protein [Daldinia caldariorum]|uniref:WD40 repeat-like protein n=1 Tax=Daldinia caldariorum TaxID=326644 RepID=UPI0020085E28|nr:WD40 repeat-like protein [Daldinia caldariorum]KAI1470150.1 WD40 repeat-like protein [Daldinia caldariorum]
MESTDSMKSRVQLRIKRAKSHVKIRFNHGKSRIKRIKNRIKGESSQAASRVQTPIPTERNQSATLPSPDSRTVGGASNESTIPPRVSYDSTIHGVGTLSEPSHDTAPQRGHDNDSASYISLPNLVTHAGDNEGNTGVAMDSQSENDPSVPLGPGQLWAAAYKRLEDDDPKLLHTYQQFLLSKGHNSRNHPQVVSEDWQAQVKKLAKEALEASQKERLSFKLREKNIVVREQLEKAMGFIVSVKDIVGAAISSEPHAALGWAGAMFVLPLLSTMLQQDKLAIEGFESIVNLLIRCKLVVDDFLQPSALDSGISANYSDTVHSLQSKIIDFYYSVYKYQISVIAHFNRSTLSKLWKDFRVKDDWKGKTGQFKATELEIREDIQALSAHKTKEIDNKLEDLLSENQNSLEEYKKIMKESLEAIKHASDLKDLPVAHSAAFESSESGRRCCTPQTQLKILSHVQEWVESPTSKPILWLHGMAGTGKSTISQTVATALDKKTSFANDSQLSDNIYLGGTFFFKQDDTSRNHASVLFTTLAHQLAHKRFGLEKEIARAINENASPNIGVKSVKVQWEELILKPLKTIQESLPRTRLVLILDALDECRHQETGTMRANIRDIVQSLGQLRELSGIQIRVLVTSRNESHIYAAFNELKDSYDHHELPKVTLDGSHNDISIFLENELYGNRKDDEYGAQWPTPVEFSKLVEKSGGLFIYAATACKFLSVNDTELAKERLDKLLEGTPSSKSPESSLDSIYRTVLDAYTRDWTEDEKQKDRLIKETLRLIVVLFKPLPINSLAELTTSKSQASRVRKCLESVRSIVDIPEGYELPVSLVHLSFHEFLLDEQRCKTTGFYVEPSITHIHLFKRCLDIMSQQLHMDMCDLKKPGVLSTEIQRDLVQQSISPLLQYACRYWVDHLLLVREAHLPQDILSDNGKVHKFMKKHILNWLEVLSLIGEVGSAVHAINHLRTLVNPQMSLKLSDFLNDSYRFTLFNIGITREAPLQVHYSSVLFSPSSSIVRRLFLGSLIEWITKMPTVEDAWGTELLNIKCDGWLDSIAASPDGKMLAAVSNGALQLFEAATGTEIVKIDFRPNQHIRKTLFSTDGQYVALGLESGLVRLYDIQTRETSDLQGHKRRVTGLAFSQSPSSHIFASISNDGSCCVWDWSRKKPIHTLQTAKEHTTAVGISPDGNFVAVGSMTANRFRESTLQVWDINTGESVITSDDIEYIRSITFSHDGDSMAVAIYDTSLKLYDTKTWLSRFTLSFLTLLSVAFSSDGKILKICSGTWTKIYFYNAVSGEKIRGPYVPPYSCWGAVFFPNGKIIVLMLGDSMRLCSLTASNEERLPSYDIIAVTPLDYNSVMAVYDGTTSFWELNEFKVVQEIPRRLECSSNSRFAVHYSENSIEIWSTVTRDLVEHFKGTGKIHFSPFGEILALVSSDVSYNIIQILEIDTWKERTNLTLQYSPAPLYVEFSSGNKPILWRRRSDLDEGSYLEIFILEKHGHFRSMEYNNVGYPTFSPDGKWMAFEECKKGPYVHLFEVETQQQRAKLPYNRRRNPKILFSPDSTLIAILANRMFTLWDMTQNVRVHNLEVTDSSCLIAISLNGEFVLDIDDQMNICDLKTNQVVTLPSGVLDYGLSFSKDSEYLISPRGRLPYRSTGRDLDYLYVSENWVLQGGERLLRLPQAYIPVVDNVVVKGATIVLGVQFSSPVFITIDLENTPLAKRRKESLQVEVVGSRITEVE